MSEKRVQIGAFLLWIAGNLLGRLILIALLAPLPALKSINQSEFASHTLVICVSGIATGAVLWRLLDQSAQTLNRRLILAQTIRQTDR